MIKKIVVQIGETNTVEVTGDKTRMRVYHPSRDQMARDIADAIRRYEDPIGALLTADEEYDLLIQ